MEFVSWGKLPKAGSAFPHFFPCVAPELVSSRKAQMWIAAEAPLVEVRFEERMGRTW